MAPARVVAAAHLATLTAGVVECMRDDAGIGTLLLFAAVVMLILARMREFADI